MTAEELKAEENALFAQWRAIHVEKYHNFVRDGIVEHEVYTDANTRPKVLFLLREANWPGEGFDHEMILSLQSGVPDRRNWRNWQVIVRWAAALTSEKAPSWEEIDDEALYQMDLRKKHLRKVAIANMKKSGGGSKVDWAQLVNYVRDHADLIRRQIDLYAPNVIICGGVGWLLERYIFSHDEREAPRWTSNDIRWFPVKVWPCAVVDMMHFGARKSHEEMYSALVKAWKEIEHFRYT